MLSRFCVVVFCLIAFVFNSFAQAPTIEWQHCYFIDSTATVYPENIASTSDGGYITLGKISSTFGQSNFCYGETDVWIVKYDSTGDLEWQKNYGGSDDESDWGWAGVDDGGQIVQTSDGGYLLASSTKSNDLDVSGLHGNSDVWVVKLNSIGVVEWQHCFGGSGRDYATSLVSIGNGEFVIGATTEGVNDGDVAGSYGNYDCWFLKIDIDGNLLKQKCLGGDGVDLFYQLAFSADSNLLITGSSTTSNNGDVNGTNAGGLDLWTFKIDTGFNILWQSYLGGTTDELEGKICESFDEGVIITCATFSVDGVFSTNDGWQDIGIIRLSPIGEFVWSKTFGGTAFEDNMGVVRTPEGKYVVGAASDSEDGDVMGTIGWNGHTWLFQIDDTGSLEWSNCYGVGVNSLIANSDGSIVLTNISTSLDSSFCRNHIVKLRGGLSLYYSFSDTSSCDSTTCNADINLNIIGGFSPYTITWSNGETTEDLTNICNGTYGVTVTDSTGASTTTLIVVTTTPAALELNADVTHATCYSTSGSITLNPSGTPPYTYAWSNGFTDQTLTNIDGDNYTVTVTDATGCSAEQTIEVTTTTPVYFTTAVSAACDSSNGSIFIGVSDGTPPFTYLINNAPATSMNPSLDSGWYAIEVIDSVGCTMTDSVYIARGVTPTACFESTNPPCSCSLPYVVEYASCSQPLTLQHEWIFAGGDIQPPFNMPHQTVVYNTGGSFLAGLTVTDSAGCSNSLWLFDYVQINDDTVYILNPIPVIEVTQSYTFISTGSENYDWSVSPSNGTLTTGDTTSAYTVYFGNTGTYVVCVKSVYPNSCGVCEVENCIVVTVKDTVDAIHQAVVPNWFASLSPNPTNNFSTLNFSSPSTEELQLNIFDATGREVKRMKIPVNASSVSVNMNDAPRGLYLCRVETHDKEIVWNGKLALH